MTGTSQPCPRSRSWHLEDVTSYERIYLQPPLLPVFMPRIALCLFLLHRLFCTIVLLSVTCAILPARGANVERLKNASEPMRNPTGE